MFQTLAQATYSYNYEMETTSGSTISPIFWLVYLAVVIAMLVAMWKLFVKAGQPGWASIVPIYNSWILVKICGKEPLWFFLLFVPLVNFVIAILLYVELAKKFGKGTGFAVLLILFPFIAIPILAFGSAQYEGGAGANGNSGDGGVTPTPPTAPTPPSQPTQPMPPAGLVQ